jgi:phage I-like protein
MPVDVTDNFIRIPVKGSNHFDHLRSMLLDAAKGIRAVIGSPKGKTSTEVQSYIFEASQWDDSKAREWVKRFKRNHQTNNWRARAGKYEGDRDIQVKMKGAQDFQLSELSPEEQGEQVSLFQAQAGGIVLNKAAVAHARQLIKGGQVKDDQAWSPSAAQMNRLLGKPANWKRYGSWHLGINMAGKEKTKDRYRFPFGHGSDVFRRALAAAAQRASQFDYPDIQQASSQLISLIKKEEDVRGTDDLVILRFTDFVDASDFAFVQEEDDQGQGKAPAEFKIVGFGLWSSEKYGDVVVDKASGKSVMAYYKMRGLDKLPIDWEHQTYNTAQNGMPAPAIGFFRPAVREDGIWAVDVDWTPQAVEWFKNKQYRHFSPTGQFDKTGRLATIKTLALTNVPATNNQEPLVAKDDGTASGGPMDTIMEALGLKPEDTEEKAVEVITDMKAKAENHDKDMKAKEDEIADFKAKADKPSEEVETLKAFRASALEICGLKEDAKPEDVKVFVATLKAQEPDKAKMAELETTVKDLQAKAEDTRVRDLVSEFSAKETPANKDVMIDLAKALDETRFRATMAQWPDVKADGPKPANDKKIDERNKPADFKLTEHDEANIQDRLYAASVERDSKEGKEIIARYTAAKKQGDALMSELTE